MLRDRFFDLEWMKKKEREREEELRERERKRIEKEEWENEMKRASIERIQDKWRSIRQTMKDDYE